MTARLLKSFVFFAPFTSYFALSGWLRLPVVLLLATFASFFASILFAEKIPAKLKVRYRVEIADILLIVFLIGIWVSFLFGFLGKRSFNHSLAYTFAVGLYYFFFKFAIKYTYISIEDLLKWLHYSSLACAGIIISDWLLVNTVNIQIRNLFVDVDHVTANMDYFWRWGFRFVGGVAEEPGSMALLFNIIFPLGLIYPAKFQGKPIQKYWIVYAISMFCMASFGGIFFMFFAYFALSLRRFISRPVIRFKWVNRVIQLLLLGLLVALFVPAVRNLMAGFWEIAMLKLSLDQQDLSSSIRTATWAAGFENWFAHPVLGQGPGYGVEKYTTGYHSVYLTLLSDTGLLPFIIFMFVLWTVASKIGRMSQPEQSLFFLSFISSSLHFLIIGDFYHAPYWIMLATIQLWPLNPTSIDDQMKTPYAHEV